MQNMHWKCIKTESCINITNKYKGFNVFINWTCRKKETKIEVVI